MFVPYLATFSGDYRIILNVGFGNLMFESIRKAVYHEYDNMMRQFTNNIPQAQQSQKAVYAYL